MVQEGRLPCGSITLYGSELWSITKLSYICGRESIQRFSAQSKDSLLHARYLLCVIFLVLAASPPSSPIGNKLLSTPSLSWTHLPYPEGFWNTGSAATGLLVASWCGGHLEDLNLPSILDLLANQQAHDSWKLATKRLLTFHSNLSLRLSTPSDWFVRPPCWEACPPLGPHPYGYQKEPQ